MREITVLSLAMGLSLGAMLVFVMRRRLPPGLFLRQPGALARGLRLLNYLYYLSREMVAASFTVARLVLDPRATLRSAILKVYTDTHGDLEGTVLANSITFLPGTIALEYSEDRVYLYVHFLKVDSTEHARERIKEDIEKYIITER